MISASIEKRKSDIHHPCQFRETAGVGEGVYGMLRKGMIITGGQVAIPLEETMPDASLSLPLEDGIVPTYRTWTGIKEENLKTQR